MDLERSERGGATTATREGPISARLRRPPLRTLKTVVLKVGGEAWLEPARVAALSANLQARFLAGERVVLVHEACGDAATTRGRLNQALVARLVLDGIPACGLSGVDLGLVASGERARVDAQRLRRLLEEGLVLVLAPVAVDAAGGTPVVDPYGLAQAVALGLGADALVLLGAGTETGRAREQDVAARLEAGVGDPAERDRLTAALAALRQGIREVRL